MTLTIDLLKSWYNQFNEEFFNNSLPQNSKILFRIKRTKKALGTCTCGFMLTPTISISDYFMRDEHDFKCTLIHEMIHLSEYCQSKTMGHGAFFKRECKRILQISNGCYVIQTRSDIKPVKVNNKYDTPIYQPIIMYQNSFSHHIILPTNINMPSIEK